MNSFSSRKTIKTNTVRQKYFRYYLMIAKEMVLKLLRVLNSESSNFSRSGHAGARSGAAPLQQTRSGAPPGRLAGRAQHDSIRDQGLQPATALGAALHRQPDRNHLARQVHPQPDREVPHRSLRDSNGPSSSRDEENGPRAHSFCYDGGPKIHALSRADFRHF